MAVAAIAAFPDHDFAADNTPSASIVSPSAAVVDLPSTTPVKAWCENGDISTVPILLPSAATLSELSEMFSAIKETDGERTGAETLPGLGPPDLELQSHQAQECHDR